MTELNGDESLLPKGRAFPINGDVVRTRRHLCGYDTQRALAKQVGISADRVMQIEAGEAKVYASTLMALAQALKIPWRTLLAEPLPAESPPTPVVPKGGKKVIFVIPSANLHELDDLKVKAVIEKARQISGIEGEIVIITVEEGSVIVTAGLSEDDCRKLMAAFADGKLSELGITQLVDVTENEAIPVRFKESGHYSEFRSAIRRFMVWKPSDYGFVYAMVSVILLIFTCLEYNKAFGSDSVSKRFAENIRQATQPIRVSELRIAQDSIRIAEQRLKAITIMMIGIESANVVLSLYLYFRYAKMLR